MVEGRAGRIKDRRMVAVFAFLELLEGLGTLADLLSLLTDFWAAAPSGEVGDTYLTPSVRDPA